MFFALTNVRGRMDIGIRQKPVKLSQEYIWSAVKITTISQSEKLIGRLACNLLDVLIMRRSSIKRYPRTTFKTLQVTMSSKEHPIEEVLETTTSDTAKTRTIPAASVGHVLQIDAMHIHSTKAQVWIVGTKRTLTDRQLLRGQFV